MMPTVSSVMATTALYGSNPYYFGGALTENATLQRALVNRLARVNGDIELAKEYTREFVERDAQQQREAATVTEVTPEQPNLLWLDTFSYQALIKDARITKAYLTTYPGNGCVPLRTLTPEELKDLGTTEL